MARKAQDVTDAELAILQILWDRGTATARELTVELYPAGTDSDVATVQKLLQRLEEKHWIDRNRERWPHVFRAAMAREDLIDRQLQTTLDKLCEGQLEPLLTHLVRARLSADQRRKLRGLLDDLDRKPSKDRP